MYKFNERRVRSLDDIPEVFKLRNNKIRSIKLKISTKPSEKKTGNCEELGRSKRYALVLLQIDDEGSQGDSSDCEEDKLKEDVSEKSTTTVDIKERFGNNANVLIQPLATVPKRAIFLKTQPHCLSIRSTPSTRQTSCTRWP